MRHEKWIKLAQKFALKSRFPNYQMAAILVKAGSVVSVGINNLSPGILKNKNYGKKAIHCELDAILGIDESVLRNCSIYIAGFSKKKNLILSAPCKDCVKLLSKCGVKHVYYHDKSGAVLRTIKC
jgi:deoxycytidylate deaminase